MKEKLVQTEIKSVETDAGPQKSRNEAKYSTAKATTIIDTVIEIEMRRSLLRQICDRTLNVPVSLKQHQLSITYGECVISMFSGPQNVCSLICIIECLFK